MRNKKVTKTQGKNYHLLFVFSLLVGVLLLIALIFKTAVIIAKSKFDNQHKFTLSLKTANNSFQVASFSPEDQSITFVNVTSKDPIRDVGKELEVPIDAAVTYPPIDSQKSIPLQLLQLASRIGINYFHFTIYDIIRLALYANSVTQSKISTTHIALPSTPDNIDTVASSCCKESTVNSENISIQIVNATGTTGIGNRLARLLTNIGCNIVLVKTGDTIIKKSEISYLNGDSSYTLKRLKAILGYQVKKMQNTTISDIIILLGEDAKTTHVF